MGRALPGRRCGLRFGLSDASPLRSATRRTGSTRGVRFWPGDVSHAGRALRPERRRETPPPRPVHSRTSPCILCRGSPRSGMPQCKRQKGIRPACRSDPRTRRRSSGTGKPRTKVAAALAGSRRQRSTLRRGMCRAGPIRRGLLGAPRRRRAHTSRRRADLPLATRRRRPRRRIRPRLIPVCFRSPSLRDRARSHS